MQLEIILNRNGRDFAVRDLGFLLHKHPDHLHERETAWGPAYVFFPEAGEERATAVLTLDVDPVALVRRRSPQAEGLLAQSVNDRPFAAKSCEEGKLPRAVRATSLPGCAPRKAG